MGQIRKVRLSCYLVFYQFISELWRHSLNVSGPACSRSRISQHTKACLWDFEWPRKRLQVGSIQILPFSHILRTSVPYPTIHHSKQKWAYSCSEWSIMGYETGAFWDLWITVGQLICNVQSPISNREKINQRVPNCKKAANMATPMEADMLTRFF